MPAAAQAAVPSDPPGQAFSRPAPRLSAVPDLVPAPSGLGWGREVDRQQEARARVVDAVAERFAAQTGQPVPPASERGQAKTQAERMLQEMRSSQSDLDIDGWAERIADELCGLGPLEEALGNPDVREIFIRGPESISIRDRRGNPVPVQAQFSSSSGVAAVVRRLAGAWFDATRPVVDARTASGAEIYAVHESLAFQGPVVSIIAPPGDSDIPVTFETLLKRQQLSPGIANLLSSCIQGGLNIALCAGPGARASELMSALADAAPPEQRAVFIRPGREPGTMPSHVLTLQGGFARIGRAEGSSDGMRGLVRAGLGLLPQRLFVHEVAGAETADVLAAMGRDLQGTVLSTRASSVEGGLHRLAHLVGLDGGLADPAARLATVATTIEVFVGLARFGDGLTRVTQVAEASLTPSGTAQVVEVLRLDPARRQWTHTGVTPKFFETLQHRGVAVDSGMLTGH